MFAFPPSLAAELGFRDGTRAVRGGRECGDDRGDGWVATRYRAVPR
jgi:hypothetical protein